MRTRCRYRDRRHVARYVHPGCACDIPPHLYSFSFESERDWKRDFRCSPSYSPRLPPIALSALEEYGALLGYGVVRAFERGDATTLRSEKRIRLFLDSAVRADWNAWLRAGLFYGVTTNPTLLARAGLRCDMATIEETVRAAFAFDIEELHVQTWGDTVETMLARGLEIAALDARIVIKVPITREGVAVVRALRAGGITTTFTALYAPHQALTAALVEAEYAAPYLGRISDSGRDGFADVVTMATILRELGSRTRLLVASIRTAADLARLAREGLDTYTIGERVASALFSDPETAAATAAFEAAATEVPSAAGTDIADGPSLSRALR